MTTKWEIVTALKTSALPSPSRHVMLWLIDAADRDTCRIPEEFSPSLTTLAGWSGISRASVAEQLNLLEHFGWVGRDRPTVEAARSKKARTRYRVAIGKAVSRDEIKEWKAAQKPEKPSPLVQELDQPASPGAGLVQEVDQMSRTSSPGGGLELVQEVDQPSPGGGLELVQELDTIPPPPFTPHTPHVGELGEPGLFDAAATPPKPETKKRSDKKTTTQLPNDFDVDDGMKDWAREHTPSVDGWAELQQFKDHHRAKGSKFVDWKAAWRTWMRNAEKFAGERRGGGTNNTKPRRATTDQRVDQVDAALAEFYAGMGKAS